MATRRQFIALGGGTLVAVSGCTGLTGPDPEVEQVDIEAGFFDLLTGSAEVSVTVVNNGGSGDVTVVIRQHDAQDTVLDSTSRTVNMANGERRLVTISVSVHSDAETVTVDASAA